MIGYTIHLPSSLFWWCAAVTTVIDALLLFAFTRWVKPVFFRGMAWPLVIAAALFWGWLGLYLAPLFWGNFYSQIYPRWMVEGGMMLAAPLYGLLAWVFHRLSLRTPVHPLLGFCALGGAESVLEHLWGFYGMHILDTPWLSQASPLSILAFAVPEYVLYWCAVILLALVVRWVMGWRKRSQG